MCKTACRNLTFCGSLPCYHLTLPACGHQVMCVLCQEWDATNPRTWRLTFVSEKNGLKNSVTMCQFSMNVSEVSVWSVCWRSIIGARKSLKSQPCWSQAASCKGKNMEEAVPLTKKCFPFETNASKIVLEMCQRGFHCKRFWCWCLVARDNV